MLDAISLQSIDGHDYDVLCGRGGSSFTYSRDRRTGTDLRELDLTSIRSLLREHAAIVPAFR